MAKQPALSFGTKAVAPSTSGARIGQTIKKQANQLSDEQRPLLEVVARQLIKGTAYGKAHAHRH